MSLSRAAFEAYLSERPGLTVSRRPEGVSAPLSFAQEQVWLHGLLAAGLPLYHETVSITYRGGVQTERLKDCLDRIAMRHELWHSVIKEIDGIPHLVVMPQVSVPVEAVDLSGLPQSLVQREVSQLAAAFATRVLSLDQGPLLRALVVKLGDSRSQIFVTFHHLIFDGVSLRQIFLPQLVALYSGLEPMLLETLPPQDLHFADFSYWQRHQIAENNDLSREYWRSRLPVLASFNLPTDRPRSRQTIHRGQVLPLVFPSEIIAGVREIARREHATIFNALLASFAVLLARYADQSTIVIGSMYGGRTHLELENVMGYFLNPIAFEINLTHEPSFQELISRVAEVVLSAMTHAAVDVQGMAGEVGVGKVGEPLAQVVFTFQPESAHLPPEWDLDVFACSNGTAKFDLHIELEEKRGEVVGRMIYNTDLFETKTIEGMAERWPTLLAAAVRDPTDSVWDLPCLSDATKAWLVDELNPEPNEFPAATVHELFHTQALSYPSRIAVAGRNENLTYQELDQRSTKLARHLRSLGCGPGSVIALMVERTPDLLIMLLGILKVGAAYLPMDSKYPALRLHQMLSAANADLLITQPHLRSKVPRDHPPVLLGNDHRIDSVKNGEEQPLDFKVSLESLAYLIFTSGSTGKPKGVEISHRALTNLLSSMRQQPGICREDVLLAVTSISFDIAALELFLPLIAGARVELADADEAADPELLRSRMEISRATIIQATPVTWQTLIESGWKGDTSLKALCGGEALPETLAAPLLERTGSLWNMYGPTEATVWSSCSRVQARPAPIVLGAPIANTTFFVLDSHQKLVPTGIPGELYIGGVGLARGYWKDPDLTSAKFPFVSIDATPPRRLYRTGDRVRRLPDGSIEFIGRLDNQIKLRGFRIELGEIEAILNRLPTIQQSVVVKHKHTSGEDVLVAYVVSQAGQSPDIRDLRSQLERVLPAYMQPSAICTLHAFPLTPNGKVDRKRLPDPHLHRTGKRPEAPLPGLEQELATIWREMLGIDHVGRHDSFFDLGGHSFLGARFIARANRTFGGPFSLVALVQAPTIASFADVVRNGFTPQISSLDQEAASAENLFWCGAEPWLLRMSRHLRDRVKLQTLTLNTRSLKSLAPNYTMEAMATRMADQITALQPEGPYLVGGFCLFALLAFETAQQLQARGLTVSLLILGDAYPPGRSPHWTLSEKVKARILREYNYLAMLLRSSPRAWRHYLRRRIFNLRGLIEHIRWQTRGRSRTPHKFLPEELNQALIMAEVVYEIHPYSGRVLFLQAEGDPNLLHKQTAPTWEGLIKECALFAYPGEHMNIFEEPHLSVAASRIRDEINRAAVSETHLQQV